MKATLARKKQPKASNGVQRGPAWDVALLYPEQGDWNVEDYLDLPGNRLVEFSDGYLEFLPMPTTAHQWIVWLLHEMLQKFVWPELGMALFAPLRVRIAPREFREPDIVFMLAKNKHKIGNKSWRGADLVMEVISSGKKARKRDLNDKRTDYAKAGIAEYWIVDPKLRQITVLWLEGSEYKQIGVFKKGSEAISRLLPGFSVDVDAVFAN